METNSPGEKCWIGWGRRIAEAAHPQRLIAEPSSSSLRTESRSVYTTKIADRNSTTQGTSTEPITQTDILTILRYGDEREMTSAGIDSPALIDSGQGGDYGGNAEICVAIALII